MNHPFEMVHFLLGETIELIKILLHMQLICGKVYFVAYATKYMEGE